MAKRPLRTAKNTTRNGNRPIKRKPNVQTQRKSIGGIKKRLVQSNKVQDARQRLILKKRQKVVDARDVLAKMAKTQDARNKLNNLRQRKAGINTASGSIKIIGKSIVKKTDRNGKISLITNKPKTATDINAAIQKQLGLIPQQKKVLQKRVLATNSRVSPLLRQTVLNEIEAPAYQQTVVRNFDASMYKWQNPRARVAASQLIGSLENKRAFFPKKNVERYVDLDAMEDEEMPMVPVKQTISLQGSSRISNIHSRLDSLPIEQETHGILSQTKTKVVVPAGHRIVVSNLQGSVTQDDVKELFEDIGQLLAARLVRPGVAEVIYKNLKDAQKAVDTYHNRQLDGQPMKCLLVNKRPLNNPTALPVSKMETQGINTIEIPPVTATNKLVPDLSTIHKVLFQRK